MWINNFRFWFVFRFMVCFVGKMLIIFLLIGEIRVLLVGLMVKLFFIIFEEKMVLGIFFRGIIYLLNGRLNVFFKVVLFIFFFLFVVVILVFVFVLGIFLLLEFFVIVFFGMLNKYV